MQPALNDNQSLLRQSQHKIKNKCRQHSKNRTHAHTYTVAYTNMQ